MLPAAVVQVLFMGTLPEFEIDFTEKYLKVSRSKPKKGWEQAGCDVSK
jgi:hypothetical protein